LISQLKITHTTHLMSEITEVLIMKLLRLNAVMDLPAQRTGHPRLLLPLPNNPAVFNMKNSSVAY